MFNIFVNKGSSRWYSVWVVKVGCKSWIFGSDFWLRKGVCLGIEVCVFDFLLFLKVGVLKKC